MIHLSSPVRYPNNRVEADGMKMLEGCKGC
jgi:hypothetical protein